MNDLMREFYEKLLQEILSNIENQYNDNYDFYRFGNKPPINSSWKSRVKKNLVKYLKLKDISLSTNRYLNAVSQLSPYFAGIYNLYTILDDEESKGLLIKLVAYKILGEEKVKLPLNTLDYWTDIEKMQSYKSPDDFINVRFVQDKTIQLYKYDLTPLNLPIKLYYTYRGIYNNAIVKQYEYLSGNVSIKIEEGDVVLDCGGCWGDTALFFANEVGEKGHVYSFEFIPDNIKTFEINKNLNSNLKDKITLVPHPLDERSDKNLFYIDNGPGSKVSSEIIQGSENVKTINIDDFIDRYNVSKVDFIKMDIEGMELPALKGGLNTIKQFKPKLAISIYHNLDDFVNIADYLKSLDLGYKFYLKHGTIHNEETVLLAITDSKNKNNA